MKKLSLMLILLALLGACAPAGGEADPRPLILTGILAAAMVIPRLAAGRKLPPVALIDLSALCGAVVYSI